MADWTKDPPNKSELASTWNLTPPSDEEISWLDAKLPFGTTPRGFIQGTLDALPVAGMVTAGALGGIGDSDMY